MPGCAKDTIRPRLSGVEVCVRPSGVVSTAVLLTPSYDVVQVRLLIESVSVIEATTRGFAAAGVSVWACVRFIVCPPATTGLPPEIGARMPNRASAVDASLVVVPSEDVG